jgi:hypothetical protein
MPPTISVLTPSYNKAVYVMDAVGSILNQNFTHWEYWLIDNSTDMVTRQKLRRQLPHDPRLHYLEYDFTQEERRDYNVQAYIVNQVYSELEGNYIFYLSDDDIIYPNCFTKMILFLDSHPEAWICYHSQQRLVWQNGRWHQAGGINVKNMYGKDTTFPGVDCVLDGGQIMHRRSCLDQLDPPFMPQDHVSACHCDGLFLQRLADRFTIYPIEDPEPLSAHRVTPLSTWVKPPPTNQD